MNDEVNSNTARSTDRMWWLGCILITAAATFLRFFLLALKPLHHDEGVNGWFLTTLFEKGEYHYDPANYHGPTLYYISLAFTKLFGLNTVSIRASVAIWGVLIVALTFFLRKYIGRIGSLCAALFLALSPGMVYISRYFIHEIFFVFLSLAVVLSIVLFIERRRAGIFAIAWTALLLLVCFLPSTLVYASKLGGSSQTAVWSFRLGFFILEVVLVALVIRMLLSWNEGRAIYLILASACVALLFATKETAFITLGTMLIACVCIWIWRRIFKLESEELDADAEVDSSFDSGGSPTGQIDEPPLTWGNFVGQIGSRTDILLAVAACSLTFVYLIVLFFSSFFTYMEGVRGAVEAYTIWTKTGSKDHTQNGVWAYLKWGLEIEAPIFILSALGILIAFVKARHRFAMFAALWGFGLFAAYTIIPYKTPWLAISFVLPMCISAGYAINEMAVARNVSLKILAGLATVVAVAVLGYQTYDLNFVRYDDEDQAYIYAHTHRDFHDLMNKMGYYAQKSGRGEDVKIEIISPDYWPMVWYLRDYNQANFHARMIESTDAEMIVAKKNEQDTEVLRKFSSKYVYFGPYHLRSGVDLVLLIRKDIADEDGKELYRLSSEQTR